MRLTLLVVFLLCLPLVSLTSSADARAVGEPTDLAMVDLAAAPEPNTGNAEVA